MKLRSWFVALALATGVSAPAVGPAATACAQESNRAALVVDTGSGRVLEMCVELNDDSVSGIELIKLANEQHDLDYRLGYGGRGVCRLANVPDERPSEECLNDHEEFWGYWRGDGNGGWTWSGTGAASTEVEEGDVEGWVYGTGRDGSSHAQPGARSDGSKYTFDSICAAISSEPSKNDTEENDSGTDESDEGTEADPQPNEPKPDEKSESTDDKAVPPAPTPEPEPDDRLIDSAPDVSELELAITPTPSSSDLPASATSAGSDDGSQPPVAGILALLATMGMAGIAFYLFRKRTPESED